MFVVNVTGDINLASIIVFTVLRFVERRFSTGTREQPSYLRRIRRKRIFFRSIYVAMCQQEFSSGY